MASNVARKLTALARELERQFIGKDEVIRLLLVSVVAGEHAVLIGPPGTAKSALIRSLARLVQARYFEYLLTRFTEPNEIFGPVDITAFREGDYRRRTAGMLPESEIVFLDEVFKSNSAILNSLLTLLNERVYAVGGRVTRCPLVSVFGASNEVPADETLVAIFDRFLLRIRSDNLDAFHFSGLLERGVAQEVQQVSQAEVQPVVALQEIGEFSRSIARRMQFDEAFLSTYKGLVFQIRAEGVSLSDRRVVKMLKLFAASAFLDGRDAPDASDLFLLKHIWNTEDQAPIVEAIVQPELEAFYRDRPDRRRVGAASVGVEALAAEIDRIRQVLTGGNVLGDVQLFSQLSALNEIKAALASLPDPRARELERRVQDLLDASFKTGRFANLLARRGLPGPDAAPDDPDPVLTPSGSRKAPRRGRGDRRSGPGGRLAAQLAGRANLGRPAGTMVRPRLAPDSRHSLLTLLAPGALGAALACGPAMVEPPVVTSSSTPPPAGASASAAPSGPAPAPVAEGDLKGRTEALVAAMARGDFAAASQGFNAAMREKLPEAKLREAWAQVEQKFGRWQATESTEVGTKDEFRITQAHGKFERGTADVRVVYDAKAEVTGLFFLAAPPPWSPPPYARPDAFEEREVTVQGVGPALPGTLTVPRGGGKHAAVVLVHGSGPSDRDESVGSVRPFKDLAWGLASRGIVVLRYEKRSRVAPTGVVTEQQEVLDGARDAIELLGKQAEVDPARRFVLGHSQGGQLAPRIARDNPSLAGVIVLAGPTRPLQDSLLEQLSYIQGLTPGSHALDPQIKAAQAFKLIVESPGLKPEQEVPFPLGGKMTGAYYLFGRGYDAAAVASKLPQRILVLQGDRDYQVTMRDLDGWKKALGASKTATLRTYPGLNHLFIAGTGPSTPQDYDAPGHVDAAVVDDLVTWIEQGKKP